MATKNDVGQEYWVRFQEFVPILMDIPQRFLDELAQAALDRGTPITRDEINAATRKHSRKDVVY